MIISSFDREILLFTPTGHLSEGESFGKENPIGAYSSDIPIPAIPPPPQLGRSNDNDSRYECVTIISLMTKNVFFARKDHG